MQQFPVGNQNSTEIQHLPSGLTVEIGKLDLMLGEKIMEDAAGEVEPFNAEEQPPAQGGSPELPLHLQDPIYQNQQL